MGYMGIGQQKWIYTQRPRKPFTKSRKPIHTPIGNSNSSTRSFTPGKYEQEQKVPILLTTILWLLSISFLIYFSILISNARANNKRNASLNPIALDTSDTDQMNAYLIDNIEYNFARGNYKYAKEDLTLLLNEQPNNKKARYIQLEIAYTDAMNSTKAVTNAIHLTQEYKLRYPLDTSTVQSITTRYSIRSIN